MSPLASLPNAGFLRERRLSQLFAALDGRGEETRVIGGAVRNAWLGLPPGDIDLATTALPPVIIERLEAAGMRAVPTGLAHGTITAIVDGQPFEVTTLREDVETDGRRARVVFGRDFAHDALRRDFTVNALSCDRQGGIFDYVGGLNDLQQRRIRFIGDARTRIREDYLRVLRFFRFHAAYGEGPLDRDGFAAAIAERMGLAQLSRERIRAELLKLLSARRAAEVVGDLAGSGLLGPLIAGVPQPALLARMIAIEGALARPPDPILRLAGLAVGVVEDADRLRAMLRLSNEEHGRLAGAALAVSTLNRASLPPSRIGLREFLFRQGRSAAIDAMILAHAAARASPDDGRFLRAHRFLADTPPPQLPFSGSDILARGIASGRAVGDLLKTLQALWIRAGFPKDPAALARLLDEALAKQSNHED
jgi:poly(A) polymerase